MTFHKVLVSMRQQVPLTSGAGGVGDRTLNLGRRALGTGSVSVIDGFSMNASLPWVSVSACFLFF